MDTVGRDLLHRIITDRPFTEYITQRIDIGDFDDEVAKRIYDGIVDLLYQGKRISYVALLEYFSEESQIGEALCKLLAK
jgi:replicative DNA helicase